ncbi:MAG: AAA family ATPase [Oscillospiraceae bacterium]|nr:AAA family ATPase [Oscillospiraceae bacterium]
MSMKEFDRIIGYDATKKELERFADALGNPTYYSALGVDLPRGLLLYGEPGVGKTTMANALIKASGRPVFTCRKDKPDGDFIPAIGRTFSEASEAAPSIVLLDDVDKFSRSEVGCCNEEEFVAVQTGIDGVKDRDVFVLATANELGILPDSLIRPGRFDRIIGVQTPTGEEAERITVHYLSGKRVAPDVDPAMIARILGGRSCAALETAVNTAGILAGYERAEQIAMRHLIMGCIETVCGVSADLIISGRPDRHDDPGSLAARAACHEAGHAVVSEILRPGSVTLVCIHEPCNGSRGFTSYEPKERSFKETKSRAVCALAGSAAAEQMFGSAEHGSASDFERAKEDLQDLITREAYCGFGLLESRMRESDCQLAATETAVSHEMNECYKEAKRILASNRPFFESVSAELLEKGILTAADLSRIKEKTA